MLISLLCIVTIINHSFSLQEDSFNPEELVNILGGTDSRYDISHGSTLPLIARPWGFNSYAPQVFLSSMYYLLSLCSLVAME